ncbi:MAG: TspO/MBR family protein [Candidatus Planktophila sp.]
MNTWRTISAIIGVALVFIYAGGANYWNRQDGWYQSLNQPSWQPPGFVFGLIWPYNFIVIGIALWVIASKASPAMVAISLGLFAISVTFALRWSYLFYEVHDLKAAASSLLTTAILTLPLLIITFSQSIKVGIALIPYQIWIFTAAALGASYAQNN